MPAYASDPKIRFRIQRTQFCLGICRELARARGHVPISRMKTPGRIHSSRGRLSGRTAKDQKWLTDSTLQKDAR